MKDFSNILWVLLILGSAIVSIVSKNKEKKEREQETPTPEHPESPWPTESFEQPQHNTIEIPKPKHNRKNPIEAMDKYTKTRSQSTAYETQFGTEEAEIADLHNIEPTAHEPTTARLSAKQKASGTTMTTTSPERTTHDATTANGNSKTEETDSIMEDFELRKAVVWSEILKPKFNDDL